MITSIYKIGQSTIYYYYDKILQGIMVTRLLITENVQGKKVWLKFLSVHKGENIFMSPDNIDIIKNHVEYYGTFGKIKVYKYVR